MQGIRKAGSRKTAGVKKKVRWADDEESKVELNESWATGPEEMSDDWVMIEQTMSSSSFLNQYKGQSAQPPPYANKTEQKGKEPGDVLTAGQVNSMAKTMAIAVMKTFWGSKRRSSL